MSKYSTTNKRLELGEAYMHCHDCGARLYSFGGSQDKSQSCPHPKKCEDEKYQGLGRYK